MQKSASRPPQRSTRTPMNRASGGYQAFPRSLYARYSAHSRHSANGRYPRIAFSNGSKASASSAVDAWGCLRSLRARSALDGVSWDQGGSVESAVGQGRCNTIHAVVCSLPLALLFWELDSASCLWVLSRLGRCELRPITQHGVHDRRDTPRQSDARLAHR
jgi:hypothetical protein